ncbi:MAG TPA: COX15/CtaA family protein [Acidobacteriaceae bacterium]|jgi:cytochrome c oxidase assembly protein subunit 15
MTTSAAIPRQPAAAPPSSPPPWGLRRFAWFVLGYNVAVIGWGAAVRATGSGGGCGEHWPLCNGTVALHHPAVATLIELSHRVTSGIDTLCVLGLFFWVFAAVPKRHLARACAVAVLILTFNEALLGALLVELGLVAHNQSPARALYLGLHLTNTLLLLAALTLTAHFLSRRSGNMRGSVRRRAPGLALTGLIAVLFVGVTGSLAALGDTLFPAHNLLRSIVQDFSPGSDWLLRIRWLHPAFSLVAGVFIVWIVARGLRRMETRSLAVLVLCLLGLQYLLGVADLALLVPTWLQMAHLLGADLLWISLVVLSARLCLVPADARAELASSPVAG